MAAYAAPIAAFLFAAIVVFIAGARLARIADTLSRRLKLGGAFFGAVFLGAATSLPGLTTSALSAWNGAAALAVSNAVGGIAAQTLFLVFADIAYRRANLEHAAASLQNTMYGTALIIMLALPLIAHIGPDLSYFSVHPASIVLLFAYAFVIRITDNAKTAPMWRPRETDETQREDESAPDEIGTLWKLWLVFAGLAALTLGAGWIIANTGAMFIDLFGVSETVVGTFFTAIATSTPELVVTIAAVRRGAVRLAIGGILGGNAFDTLFIAASDVAYRDGSIYHAMGEQQAFWLVIAIAMTALIILGMLARERHGPANVGFEGIGIIALYLAGAWMSV